MSRLTDNAALAMPGMIWKENTPHRKGVTVAKSWIRLADEPTIHYGWTPTDAEILYTRVINTVDVHPDTVTALVPYIEIVPLSPTISFINRIVYKSYFVVFRTINVKKG